jgi:hypothetical protein
MRNIVAVLVFFTMGLFLGSLGGLYLINTAGNNPKLILRNGVWKYFASMDLAENKLQRAFIGRLGLFALQDSEVLYFIADKDNEGKPLDPKSTYKISGNKFNARYWSITLYGEDHYLIPNKTKTHSYNQNNIFFKDTLNSEFEIFVSKKPSPMNWLPTNKASGINLLLRLYNPDEKVYKNKGIIRLPTIEKVLE